jgi:hypothetical protein
LGFLTFFLAFFFFAFFFAILFLSSKLPTGNGPESLFAGKTSDVVRDCQAISPLKTGLVPVAPAARFGSNRRA